ncbi:MAG: 3-dehydroquinate synthase [Hyphomonadaceae bacterium]
MSAQVRVALDARSYDVVIGADLLRGAGAMIAPFARRVAVVTDANVAALHLDALMASLAEAGVRATAIVIPPGEAQKSFAGLEKLSGDLLAANLERKDLVVALGGGVIGDLAGFTAGIVKRGIDFVQIPTTLLAQVDSSVGGKTAIDTPHGKNLVGLFHQPRLVLADLTVLKTLPPREMRAGYAEIVKYGLIADADFFAWCEANAARLLAGDEDALLYAVKRSVEMKAEIVAADEREAGARALLNLGHTFAHALETHAGYDGALLHGEAVAAGADLAFKLSARIGLCPAADASRVHAHLETAGFVTDLRKLPGAPFDPEKLLTLMYADKKAENGALTLILARAIGAAFVQKAAPAEEVKALLREEARA